MRRSVMCTPTVGPTISSGEWYFRGVGILTPAKSPSPPGKRRGAEQFVQAEGSQYPQKINARYISRFLSDNLASASKLRASSGPRPPCLRPSARLSESGQRSRSDPNASRRRHPGCRSVPRSSTVLCAEAEQVRGKANCQLSVAGGKKRRMTVPSASPDLPRAAARG